MCIVVFCLPFGWVFCSIRMKLQIHSDVIRLTVIRQFAIIAPNQHDGTFPADPERSDDEALLFIQVLDVI